jgi:poly-gamma-glutamate capsule biosynthesis protein CapA/YwtB (metallophosphatase superfamily)
LKRRWLCAVALSVANGAIVLSQPIDSVARATLLFFGDINLGRKLGQELLKGKTDYPFERMRDILSGADGVFANLESPITEQNGETESPVSNYVFCAPPVAAKTLERAGITIVSTANNHVFDYSLRGLVETMQNLNEEHIRYVGTSLDSVRRVPPAIVRYKDLRVGFLAYTQHINADGPWRGRIAVFDSVRARKDIRLLRPKVDFVIVSYHGGTEYAEKPDEESLGHMRSLARAGADLVVGHHPHVPQGIELLDNRLIFYSLGNFVFNQAEPWAKRSFGVEVRVSKRASAASIESIRLIPFRPYKQPAADLSPMAVQELIERLRRTSNIPIVTRGDSIFVNNPQYGYSR